MARYEKLGFCPETEFTNQTARKLVEHPNGVKVKESIGSLLKYMVYMENSFDAKGCYITEALLTTESLGTKIAAALNKYITSSFYTVDNTIIWLEDCINPAKVKGTIMVEDEKFYVGITNCAHVTHISMYKK